MSDYLLDVEERRAEALRQFILDRAIRTPRASIRSRLLTSSSHNAIAIVQVTPFNSRPTKRRG